MMELPGTGKAVQFHVPQNELEKRDLTELLQWSVVDFLPELHRLAIKT